MCLVCIAVIMLSSGCAVPNASTPQSQPLQPSSQDGAPSAEVATKLVWDKHFSSRTGIPSVNIGQIEACKSLSATAQAKGIKAVWKVTYSYSEPCQAGTQFCSADGKRPVNSWDHIYTLDGSWQVEGTSFSDYCR